MTAITRVFFDSPQGALIYIESCGYSFDRSEDWIPAVGLYTGKTPRHRGSIHCNTRDGRWVVSFYCLADE